MSSLRDTTNVVPFPVTDHGTPQPSGNGVADSATRPTPPLPHRRRGDKSENVSSATANIGTGCTSKRKPKVTIRSQLGIVGCTYDLQQLSVHSPSGGTAAFMPPASFESDQVAYYAWTAIRETVEKTMSLKDKQRFTLHKVFCRFLIEQAKTFTQRVPGRTYATLVDPTLHDNAKKLVVSAAFLQKSFEAQREEIPASAFVVAIPATEAGIEAVRVISSGESPYCNNQLTMLTLVTGGPEHVRACAKAGATAICIPWATISKWYERRYPANKAPQDSKALTARDRAIQTVRSMIDIIHTEFAGPKRPKIVGACFDSLEDKVPLEGLDAVALNGEQLEELSRTTFAIRPRDRPAEGSNKAPSSGVHAARTTFETSAASAAAQGMRPEASRRASSSRKSNADSKNFMARMSAEDRSLVVGTMYEELGKLTAQMRGIYEALEEEFNWQMDLKHDYTGLQKRWEENQNTLKERSTMEDKKRREKEKEAKDRENTTPGPATAIAGPKSMSAGKKLRPSLESGGQALRGAQKDKIRKGEAAEQEKAETLERQHESDTKQLLAIPAAEGNEAAPDLPRECEEESIMDVNITDIPVIPDEELEVKFEGEGGILALDGEKLCSRGLKGLRQGVDYF